MCVAKSFCRHVFFLDLVELKKYPNPLFCHQEGVCTIEKVPFRGAPCSDAAGKQKAYKWIMQQVNGSMTGRLWDDNQKAPYFNYKVFSLYFNIYAIYVGFWMRLKLQNNRQRLQK